jgi:uncharacterized protein
LAVLPRTAGLLYWGVAAWRSGIFREPERHKRALVSTLVIAGAAGAIFTRYPVGSIDAAILLAAAYVSGLFLLLTPRRIARLPGLAALGQMALTNYLTQSIILGFIFYSYGFGFFGRMGPYTAASVGMALYIVQIEVSRWWLGRYRFGPFEWLWRSLTYGRRQPMIPYH